MGCDIHSIAQVKTKDGWKTVAARPGGDDRNYDTFAVLADVRNGYGFAGTPTGEGWPVMFEPRGLPDDLEAIDGERVVLPEPYYYSFDKEKKDPQHELWLGDHTYSHLSLAELKLIMKQFARKKYTRSGMISKKQAEELKEGKTPDSWCGWTNQAGYVEAEWKVPATEALWGLKNIIDALDEIAKEHKATPEDVRLVFGFDS